MARCVGIFLVLSCFWWLMVPGDAAAGNLPLQTYAEKTRATRTLSADIELTYGTPDALKHNVGTIRLMKPNFAIIKLQGDYPVRVLASDGKSVLILSNSEKFTQRPVDSRGAAIDSPWFGFPFRYFFTQSANPFGADPDPEAKLSDLGDEVLDGEHLRVISANGTKPMPYAAKFYFGSDGLMHRSVVEFGSGTVHTSFSSRLTNIKTDGTIKVSEFGFTPPSDAKPDTSSEDKMLALGTLVPLFDLLTPAGNHFSLSQAVKANQATLVNFWFLACPPCRKEIPEFQSLYTQLSAHGFTIVAVNMGDTAKEVEDYSEKQKLTFPIVMGGNDTAGSVFRQYSIVSYPATYLVDSQGKVIFKTVGSNIEEIRQAIASLGVK